MLGLTWQGKSFKKWLALKFKESFISKNVPCGRIAVIWHDVDDMVYGWDMKADDELGLLGIAGLIAKEKHDKLYETINGKGEQNGKRKNEGRIW